MSDRATELEYLRWFYDNADFGPADEEVRDAMDKLFRKQTGLKLPLGFYEEE